MQVKQVTLNTNTTLPFEKFNIKIQEGLREEILKAENVRRSYGFIFCPHHKYLVRDICVECRKK